MKYYYEKPKEWVSAGSVYQCNHPLFNRCTLFQNGTFGLCVVQEHFNEKTKARWWGSIDPWLACDIYFHEDFHEIFEEYAAEMDENGLYPVIQVRKLMWMLRMKPLRKEFWEKSTI